jgi:hydroxyethylthiazole kinase-like uncharacterized protein yjeF
MEAACRLLPELLPKGSIITPHGREFELLKSKIKNQKSKIQMKNLKSEKQVQMFAKDYNLTVLLKGEKDIVCSPDKCIEVTGGNAGMTKGGTGDVLAGLVAALNCNNDPFLAAMAGSYICKKSGEKLFEKVGYNFNASDLAEEITYTIKNLLEQ